MVTYNPNGGQRRSKRQRMSDLPLVADFYRQGLPQHEIAERLTEDRAYKLSRQSIANDIKAVKEQWLLDASSSFDERVAEELAKIDYREQVAWQAWHRSLEDTEIRTKKSIKGDRDIVEAIIKNEKNQVGDPRFLVIIQGCGRDRRELLGLDAAVNIDLTSGGEKMTITEVSYTVLPSTADLGDISKNGKENGSG